MERKITVENKQLTKLLKERAPFIEKGRDITKQIEELEKERNKLALQAQKVTTKITKIIEKVVYPQLAECEFVSAVSLKENEVQVSIFDHLKQVHAEVLKRWNAEVKKK